MSGVMMTKKIMRLRLSLLMALLVLQTSAFAVTRYGETICHQTDYHCKTIKSGESWSSLFNNPEQMDIVKRINRMNSRLRPGMTIAVPNNIDRLSIYDVSPFPRYIEETGEKTIYVSQDKLAWGAYDESGELIWWGPISTGANKCSGVRGGCHTPTGEFRIIRKQDIDCISTEFPINADGTKGGAEMPYCMHFYRGYALHGSETVPGYRDSHGCVRLFTEDARWLNEEFVDIPGDGFTGTRVIIDEANQNY